MRVTQNGLNISNQYDSQHCELLRQHGVITYMMSHPVSRRLVGKRREKSGVSLGHPRVAKGQRPELNQVSSTSSSRI